MVEMRGRMYESGGLGLMERRRFLKLFGLAAVPTAITTLPALRAAPVYTNVYLFDEKRWYEDDLDEYADFLRNTGVTDLLAQIYGHYKGGTMGWRSNLIDLAISGVTVLPPADHLDRLIATMGERGIKVHGVFLVSKWDAQDIYPQEATQPFIPKNYPGSKLVDVGNPAFQEFISDLMAQAAAIPGLAGVCLDFIRADPTNQDGSPADATKNDTDVKNVVRKTYEKCKLANPNTIISSTTGLYGDTVHPTSSLLGRKAINWANDGIMDVCHDIEYDHPPKIADFNAAKALMDDPGKAVIMIGVYEYNASSIPVPVASSQFHNTLDIVKDEVAIGVYNGTHLTTEHAALIAQLRRE
jgi:hypothetical protein